MKLVGFPLSCMALLCALIFASCKKNDPMPAPLDKIEVTYLQNVCCENMFAIDTSNLPQIDSCGLPYSLLFAVNLETFNIPQKYQYGDTLLISFAYTSVCEAEGPTYNCLLACDRRHGIPIELLSVE